ncbi:MAG: hypothetical protein E5Y02_09245 [Mesorhizobium sp.]|nr:MAG: hypothetical protein E5Y02_09245 [Mesorhizobium sp.]
MSSTLHLVIRLAVQGFPAHCPKQYRFDRIVVDDLEQEKKMPKPWPTPRWSPGDLTGLACGDFAGDKARATPQVGDRGVACSS